MIILYIILYLIIAMLFAMLCYEYLNMGPIPVMMCIIWPIFMPMTIFCWIHIIYNYLYKKMTNLDDLNQYQIRGILEKITKNENLPILMGLDPILDKYITHKLKKNPARDR
jgi:hypothetical protein